MIQFLKTHSICVFLSLVLLFSIAGNLYLGNKALFYYTSLNALRLDPIEQDFYPHEDLLPSDTIRVVMLGDSRALAWPSLKYPNVEQYNRGIHGQTSLQIRSRFRQHVASLHPDIVIFQFGINDFKTIGIFPKQKQKIIVNCIQNLDALIQEALSIKAKVILTTTVPAGPISLLRKAVWSEDTQDAVREFNKYMHTINKKDVFVLDTIEIVQNSDGTIPSSMYTDELHLHEKAYSKLNIRLEEMLKEITTTSAKEY